MHHPGTRRILRLIGRTVGLLFVGCGFTEPPERLIQDLSAGFAAAEPNVPTRHVSLAEADELLGEGWAERADRGEQRSWRWIVGRRATLRLFWVHSRSAVTLRAQCWPLRFQGAPAQTLQFSLNGQELGARQLDGGGNIEVPVPAEAWRAGWNRLALEAAWAEVPKAVLPGSRDPRPLSVACEEIDLEGVQVVERPLAQDEPPALLIPTSSQVDYFLRLPSEARLRLEALDAKDAAKGASPALEVEVAIDGSDATAKHILRPETGPRSLPLVPSRLVRETPLVTRVTLRGVGEAGTLRLLRPRIVASAERKPAAVSAPQQGGSAMSRPRAKPPHVLIYMIDTLRADHLGTYGYERDVSPRIDAFARDATLYLEARSQTSWTRPAVASLLTGLPPWVHGAIDIEDALPGSAWTMAEALYAAGYQTAAIVTNGNVSPDFGFGQGFESFRMLEEDLDTERVHEPADRVSDLAIAWLRERDRHRPFFLYLHVTDPHGPYAPPEPYRSRFAPDVNDTSIGSLERLRDLNRMRAEVPPELPASLAALYDAEIAFVDAQFGRLLDALAKLELEADTLVVVVSDHGEEFYEHGWWEHGKTLYGEQLRIPLIIRFPGGAGAGRRESEDAMQIDLLPTVLAAAGVDPPAELPGRRLRSGGVDRDRPQIAHLEHAGRNARSILLDGFKWIEYGEFAHPLGRTPRTELFDLARDPGERENLVAARPVRSGFLRSRMRQALAADAAQEGAGSAVQVELDTEQFRRLKALGYVE